MGIPFSPQEQATLTQRLSEIPGEITAANNAIAGQQAQIQIDTDRDSVNKTAMEYYDDIAIAYEEERKNINGEFITSPFSRTTDIDQGALREIGTRFWPVSNVTNDPTRFSELDGGGIDPSLFAPRELIEIVNIQPEIDKIKTGFNDGSGTAVVFSAYSGGLTLEVESGSNITSGNRIVVGSALLVAGDTTVGGSNDTIDILEEIVPGTAMISDSVDESFPGFNNTERTNETPSNPIYQNIFNKFAQDILDVLALELVPIAPQKTVLQNNPDDESTGDVLTRISDAINSITNLENTINTFIATPDYSDTGLGVIETEISNRQSFISTRLSQIDEALKTAPSNIYDKRFTFINLRINAVEGSLRKLVVNQTGLGGLQSKKANLEDTQTVYGGL